jgi:hypothetical protein
MILHRISAVEADRLLEIIITERIRTLQEISWAIVLDFDGVLSSKTEDWIFRLDESPGEAGRLQYIAKAFGLNLSGYDVPYQRHLLYQAAAAELHLPIEEGPAVRAATHAADLGAKLFVLTARSGLQAILRMKEFLEERCIQPTETYHIGRVPKDRQIALVLDSLPDHNVLFIEDVEEHVDQIRQVFGESERSKRLEVVLIEHDAARRDVETLRRKAWSVLESGAQHRQEKKTEQPTRFEQLKEALNHARTLFVCHAGQRRFITSLQQWRSLWLLSSG